MVREVDVVAVVLPVYVVDVNVTVGEKTVVGPLMALVVVVGAVTVGEKLVDVCVIVTVVDVV